MDDIAYWLALLRAPGIGPVTYRSLLARYGDPRAVFAQARGGPAAGRLHDGTASGCVAQPDWRRIERDLLWLTGAGHHAITIRDQRYPALLKEIPDAPPVLFVRGDPAHLSRLQIAIVGSRNPTPSGAELAHEFAAGLAGGGLAVTSGLALGIDVAAHRGALAAQGVTIAVAATGLDRVYPAAHRRLADEIAGQGALVSELPLGSPPLPRHFPRRNRIISGLSLGTLVVEAAPRSGSLITARCAAEQGREVFAIPGSIHNPLARGCHALLRDGAKLVERIHDILEELGPLAAVAEDTPAAAAQPTEDVGEGAAEVLAQIDHAPVSVDILVRRTGYPAGKLCPILLELEMAGHITSAPGGAYARRSKGK